MIQKGEILDGMYQIIQEIGQGGTGIIYLAEHLRLQKRVVVKRIKDNFVGQINGRAEVDILKRLHHTCLPQVYDFLVIGSSIYTVMEYVQGYDLQVYLDQGYQFSEQIIRKWLLQLTEVLDYLHSQNPPILHSDIKPSNLMVTPDQNICLIDFNISLDGENSKDIQGISQWYAAPEQYEKAMNVLYGRQDHIVLDGRMDIYSLGATFYTVMTGLLPSPGKQRFQDITDMDIPFSEGMKAVISKCMKHNPTLRFSGAGQMHKYLLDIGKMDPVYKRMGHVQAAVCLLWCMCIIAGIMFIYYGNWKNGVENWQRAYRELYVSTEIQDEAEIISKGTEILNESVYKGYLKKNPGKRAEVLHILGDSYFRQANYRESVSYYKEAWELSQETGGYCMDYVIALVRNNQITKASQIITSAEGLRGLSAGEQKLIQAEIAWMRGGEDEAEKYLEEMFSAEIITDTDILMQGRMLQADIYEEQGQYEKAMQVLEEAITANGDRNLLRRLGQVSVKAADDCENETDRNTCLKRALECYDRLNENTDSSYEDKLNLALVKQALGNYEESNNLLQRMAISYPEDYRIPMWRCYNYLSIAKEENSYEEVWEDLIYQYGSCKHMYDLQGIRDGDMEELIEIMEELEVQKKGK